MGRDKLGDCSDGIFFFWGFGDDNVRIGGVSSSFASKFEVWIWYLFFVRCSVVTDPSVTLARKVGPGLQDLQTRARRILAEKNAEKAKENTWISRMVATESIGELDGLIKSRAA